MDDVLDINPSDGEHELALVQVDPGDDFEDTVRRAAEARKHQKGVDPWKALTAGKTIGKSVNVAVPTNNGVLQQLPPTNLFEVGGASNNALQLCLTLGQPLIIPASQLPGGVIPANQSDVLAATNARTNIDILSLPFAPIGPWIPTVAILEWGCGGVAFKAEIDWVNGTTINLSASWLRLSAQIDVVNNEIFTFSDAIMQLQGFVGPGGIQKGSGAQRTIDIGIVFHGPPAPGVFGASGFPGKGFGPNQPVVGSTYPIPIFPVPAMARTVIVMAVTPTLQELFSNQDWSAQVLFYRSSGGGIIAASRFSNSLKDPAPIPNGAQFFSIQNEGNDVDHILFACQAIFQLSI